MRGPVISGFLPNNAAMLSPRSASGYLYATTIEKKMAGDLDSVDLPIEVRQDGDLQYVMSFRCPRTYFLEPFFEDTIRKRFGADMVASRASEDKKLVPTIIRYPMTTLVFSRCRSLLKDTRIGAISPVWD